MGRQSLTAIWQQALAHLSRRMEDPSLETWLSDTEPLGVYQDVMFVRFPNAFTRDWVEARYATLLEQAVEDFTGISLRLEFVLEEEMPVPPNGSAAPKALPPVAPTASRGQRMAPAPARPLPPRPNLQPRYTFDNFVVGSANQFPHAAALAVAEAPGRAYNPLFLYGGVGLGKTHLMQAIGHQVLENTPDAYVMYVTSETFTNDLINSITRKAMEEFRNRYRSVDVLLIDDIHFVAGKESTQEEFFHTFNALYEANKQIVLSSDRLPKDIPTLEERLRSRFEWGLTADLQMPDFETRIAILQGKVAAQHIAVPYDVLAFIAERVQSSVRELEGALIRLLAFADIHRLPVTLDLALEVLKDLAPAGQAPITIAAILHAVAGYYGLTEADLKARRRHREVAHPRQVAMYLARELTDASLPRIGQEFGGRDHSTVLHAYEKIRQRLQEEPELADAIRHIREKLQNPAR